MRVLFFVIKYLYACKLEKSLLYLIFNNYWLQLQVYRNDLNSELLTLKYVLLVLTGWLEALTLHN